MRQKQLIKNNSHTFIFLKISTKIKTLIQSQDIITFILYSSNTLSLYISQVVQVSV